MDWKECGKNKLEKEIKVDKSLVSSLLKTSANKLKTQEMIKLDDTTSVSKISLMYDALREILEALSVSKGYKIYNHECYVSFLKEILKESRFGDRFDNFRKIRNAVNYYGKEISAKEAESVLKEMEEFIDLLKKKFF